MEWTVLIGHEFDPEFLALPREVHEETLAMARLLRIPGLIWDIRVSPSLKNRNTQT